MWERNERAIGGGGCLTEHPLSIRPQRPVGRDMPIERLSGDPELFAQRADVRLAFAHARHREPELRCRHLWLAASDASARAGGRKPGSRALHDKLALELGECGEDAEDEFASGRRRVDRRALAAQDAQPDAGGGELMHGVDEVAQVAPESIELPHDERVSLAKRLQAGGEAWAVVLLAGRRVAVEVSLGDACGNERVALQVEHLRAVGFRDAHVADQGREGLVTQTTVCVTIRLTVTLV